MLMDNKMRRMVNLLFGASLGLATLSFTCGHAVADIKGDDLIVTIEANHLPFRDVLADISSQTQWNIVFDEKLADKAIAGNFQNVGLDSFLKRTLRNENLIVLYDENSKTVDIRSFGGTGKQLKISSIPPNPSNLKDEKKLQALTLEEQRAFDVYISNPDSVEPMTGMTLGEIAALRVAEQKAYDEFMSNPESIDPITGMTLSKFAALREAEQKAYDEFMSNPESIDPITGMTLAKVKALGNEEQRVADNKSKSLDLSTQ